MFTGIIQQRGAIAVLKKSGESGRLELSAAHWGPALEIGESIAVQGACLTLTAHSGGRLCFDVLAETFSKTCLGDKKPGQLLNLERALRVGDSLGGHFVSGHVDGTGRVHAIKPAGRDWVVEIACSPELLMDMLPKGSICIDGISLTIVDLTDHFFSVHIIPHTWTQTSMGELKVGEKVNLETDMLGKYVRKCVRSSSAQEKITWDLLGKSGYNSLQGGIHDD